ncbi:hypothetical protein BDZ89DRAFT_1155076 [Hymenopellis radicata]|nr:hypothetical protein BDZ89DRAFT_1155076 [Hymenopellis radicata]
MRRGAKPSPSFPLLQLPNELLHKIFADDFDWDDQSQIVQLFRVSLTCKRLHDICLMSYLAHFGITNPTVLSQFRVRNAPNDQHDAISGLRAAIFVPFIQHLSCTFEDHDTSFPESLPPQSTIIQTVERLRLLVAKLSSLSQLTLRFSGRDWNHSSVQGTDVWLAAWSSAIGSLLNLCAEKGCTSICLLDGKVMNYAYQFVYTRGGAGGLPVRRNAIRGPGWEFKRVKMGEQTILVEPAPPQHSELTISHIAFASHLWQALLPTVAIAAPDLASLSVLACPDITIDDMLRFIALFPCLKSLRVSDEEQYMPGKDVPIPEFKELVKVEAPWRILVYVVQSSLPNLREVRTFPRRSPRRGLDWEGTGSVMRALKTSFVEMEGLERLPLVALRVIVDAGWLTRISVVPSAAVKKALRLVNVVEIQFQTVKVEIRALANWILGAFESVREIRMLGNYVACYAAEEDISEVMRDVVKDASVVVLPPGEEIERK